MGVFLIMILKGLHSMAAHSVVSNELWSHQIPQEILLVSLSNPYFENVFSECSLDIVSLKAK